jgi:hypothetical protein
MEYKGKLYGKSGDVYFPMVMTSDDVDKLEHDKKALADNLKNSVSLLKKALKDLNTVPNRKYCENYKTVGEIEAFLKENLNRYL